MLLSHLYEAAGGRLHYFIIPLALGLVSLKEREDGVKRERYSTQHLQDLAQRGWRKNQSLSPSSFTDKLQTKNAGEG